MTQPNTVKTPSYRAIAPLHRQPSIHPHPFPVRRSNTVSGSPLQDPSALVYPGRGLPTRPGRQSPSTVADPSSGGYPPLPYQNGQSLDPMSQFMRAAHPQIQHASHLGPGHLKGVPHFLQPRVAHPPPTSILDNGGRKNSRSRNDVLVLVRKRKVRITEGASLYSLCRSWLRNGAHEGLQRWSETMSKGTDGGGVNRCRKERTIDEKESERKQSEEKWIEEKRIEANQIDSGESISLEFRQERRNTRSRFHRLRLHLPLFCCHVVHETRQKRP
ncbi:hypothetical protein F2Q68_00024620 [Brassica cretica]|uniref:Uncharacterized protein n=1 Tax=Brassica cretica TaxID=69181 RepID=A0A8S9I8D6_BRACR|nr:hypothetical protein F2Q68_00024620 [Brassica cretica]